jgi:uncharacterized integral membrane protein
MGRHVLRNRSREQWRDLAVRLLARLSLVVVLAVLGALFVGTAATSQAASDPVREPSLSADEPIRPAGLVLGAALIGGGLVVLMIGAFRPPARTDRHELANPPGH